MKPFVLFRKLAFKKPQTNGNMRLKKFDFNKKKLIDFTTFYCKVKIDLFIFRKMVPQFLGSIDTTYYAEYNL